MNNKVIYKYMLHVQDLQTLSMHKDAEILDIQAQGNDFCGYMWALVDLNQPQEMRMFRTIGTGNYVQPGTRRYLATYQVQDMVWHVFEEFPS